MKDEKKTVAAKTEEVKETVEEKIEDKAETTAETAAEVTEKAEESLSAAEEIKESAAFSASEQTPAASRKLTSSAMALTEPRGLPAWADLPCAQTFTVSPLSSSVIAG